MSVHAHDVHVWPGERRNPLNDVVGRAALGAEVEAWIADDPDPSTRAELTELVFVEVVVVVSIEHLQGCGTGEQAA